MFGTRSVLGEIRDLRKEMRDLHEEIRSLHAENSDALRFMGEVVRRNELAFMAFAEEMRELRAESKAHTDALFVLIDRLGGGGAAPAT